MVCVNFVNIISTTAHKNVRYKIIYLPYTVIQCLCTIYFRAIVLYNVYKLYDIGPNCCFTVIFGGNHADQAARKQISASPVQRFP